MANKSLSELLANNIKSAAGEVVETVANETIKAGTQLIRNSVEDILGNKSKKPASQQLIEVDPEEEHFDLDESESPLPAAFDMASPGENLSCAAAAWRIWGKDESDLEEETDLPDIVALQEDTGIAFVGNELELAEFCEHHDLDVKWEIFGTSADGSYDSSIIRKIPVSKSVLNYVTATLLSKSYDKDSMEKAFKENHLEDDISVTRVVRDFPFMEGVPMQHFAIPYAIIYGARKDGKFQTYIHEFGENSKKAPMMYTIGDGKSKSRGLYIGGGDMETSGGFIKH